MDRNKYLTTGELAGLMNITKNTLFHYDKIGLFSPEIVLENEYRYYSIHQMEVLDTIIMLKELGMPLKEIRGFLDGRSPRRLLELFEKEEQQIQDQIEKLKDHSRFIHRKREKIQNVLDMELDHVYIKTFPERYYLIRTLEGTSETDLVEKIKELIGLYQSRNHSMCYDIGYIQYGKDVLGGIYDHYQNVILLMEEQPDELDYRVIPKGEYLTVYFKAHWKDIGKAYEILLNYAKEQHLILDEEFLEVSAVDNLMAQRLEDYVTEVTVKISGDPHIRTI